MQSCSCCVGSVRCLHSTMLSKLLTVVENCTLYCRVSTKQSVRFMFAARDGVSRMSVHVQHRQRGCCGILRHIQAGQSRYMSLLFIGGQYRPPPYCTMAGSCSRCCTRSCHTASVTRFVLTLTLGDRNTANNPRSESIGHSELRASMGPVSCLDMFFVIFL